MATILDVKAKVVAVNAKLDAVIANPPPAVATQSDLDELAAGLDAAGAKADQLPHG